MSAMDEANQELPEFAQEALSLLSGFFWKWYENHLDDHVVTVKVVIFKVNVYVRSLTPLFTMLFGPKPA
jgi:hypothetical protein